MDKGKDIRFVICDVCKASERVLHHGLLFKLKHYGVAGNVLSWIEHYLTDRKEKVVAEGFSSSFLSPSMQESPRVQYLVLFYCIYMIYLMV